jgi:hypothetical protein
MNARCYIFDNWFSSIIQISKYSELCLFLTLVQLNESEVIKRY